MNPYRPGASVVLPAHVLHNHHYAMYHGQFENGKFVSQLDDRSYWLVNNHGYTSTTLCVVIEVQYQYCQILAANGAMFVVHCDMLYNARALSKKSNVQVGEHVLYERVELDEIDMNYYLQKSVHSGKIREVYGMIEGFRYYSVDTGHKKSEWVVNSWKDVPVFEMIAAFQVCS